MKSEKSAAAFTNYELCIINYELLCIFALEMNQATLDYIREHAEADVRQLALQGTKNPEVDLPFALDQIAGRQKAKIKLPTWAATDGIIYPPHLSMEQCSSEQTARYKGCLAGTSVSFVDLTGGFGVDFAFIASAINQHPSPNTQHLIYVEQQASLCAISSENFKLLGLNHIEVVCADGVEYLHQLDHADLIFLDPARRDNHGARTYGIADCTPNVLELRDELLQKADRVMLKLSPMLDVSKALTELYNVSHVFIIGLEGECKEITLLMQRDVDAEPVITAVDIKANGTPEITVSSAKSADNALPLPIADPQQLQPGTYISEPSAPYMKSALFRTIAAKTNTSLLHPDTHLFWSKEKPENFPGRTFQLEGIIPFDKRSLSSLAKTQANLSVRNFPESAPALQQRLKLRDGGPRYLIAIFLDPLFYDYSSLFAKLHRILQFFINPD